MYLSILKKALVLVFLSGIVILSTGAACSKSSNFNSPPATKASISIENTFFAPSNITISKGTIVTWVNNDTLTHQIESDDNLTNFLSGELESSDTYSFTFDQTGTFGYHCKIHPGLTGQIIVK